jgi:hypothetical protein
VITIADLVAASAVRAAAKKAKMQYREGRSRPRRYGTSEERDERWKDRRARYLSETGREEVRS